jgi:glucosamine--fructose-6-phosphate aminotransferase (isomerizing)
MCGIVGYVGRREAEPILVDGLRRLEYRGYDSAGLATLAGRHLHLRKRAGRVIDLTHRLAQRPAPGCLGISHTRWATHGRPTDANAHPHMGGTALWLWSITESSKTVPACAATFRTRASRSKVMQIPRLSPS